MGPDDVNAEDDQPPQPPPDLRRRAHVAGNGELLWPRAAALEAARWAANAGCGIWGGEVFAPRGPFTAVMVREWRTEPEWHEGEPWAGFVARALEQTVAALERDESANQEGLLYFLAYASGSRFADESRRARGASTERWLDMTAQEARSDG